jgi:DNA-binding LacI/PurR family transcriptional regulator
MGFQAIKLLISEIEKETKPGQSIIYIEEEFLWKNSVKRKVKK